MREGLLVAAVLGGLVVLGVDSADIVGDPELARLESLASGGVERLVLGVGECHAAVHDGADTPSEVEPQTCLGGGDELIGRRLEELGAPQTRRHRWRTARSLELKLQVARRPELGVDMASSAADRNPRLLCPVAVEEPRWKWCI